MFKIGQLVVGLKGDNVMYHDIVGLVGVVISKPNSYGQYCVFMSGMELWLLKDNMEVIK
jgi:hypothetical protein